MKGPYRLTQAGSRAARGLIRVSGVHNGLGYCEIFMVFTQYTNVASFRIVQPGGLQFGELCIIRDRAK